MKSAGATRAQLATVTGGSSGEESRAASSTTRTRAMTLAIAPSFTMS